MKCLVCLIVLSLVVSDSRAQVTGNCEPAEAEAYLDANNVRARILNNGSLFWRGSPSVYEVPKGSGINASFNTTIWIGGLVQDELRMAAARYGKYQFWPGPLTQKGLPPKNCAIYDHIYEITQTDIADYNESGIISDNLKDWPWKLGAPVIDGDGIIDNYNLEGGDRPELIGDQMLWWIMNDAGNKHEFWTQESLPIGLEVHGSAFAFIQPHSYIGTTTFYRFKVIYKGQAPLQDAYFGIYADTDLGNFADDFVGSDSLLHLAFDYNGDNDDEGGGGYGLAPPAIGYTFLRTAPGDKDGRDNDYDTLIDEPGEELGMTSFMRPGDGGGVTETPGDPQDYYYYMQARWKNGRPLVVGGYGYEFSTTPTNYALSGDPVTSAFWSEINVDNLGTANSPGWRIFLMSSGPFTMQPGASEEILFAIVWSRGSNHLDSVRQLKADVRTLHENADQILTPTTFPEPLQPVVPKPVLGFAQNYPNPFSETTTIRYSLPKQAQVRLAVYDVLGREIAVLVEAEQEAGVHAVDFDARTLPKGVYLARLQVDSFAFTKKLVVAR